MERVAQIQLPIEGASKRDGLFATLRQSGHPGRVLLRKQIQYDA